MRAGGWLGRTARALAREWRHPLAGTRAGMTADGPARPLPSLPASLVTDGEVLRALTRLREASRWERLEMGRNPETGALGGYCADPGGRNIEVADALAMQSPPEAVIALRDLLLASGWQRLEAVAAWRGVPYGGGTGGFCERADGSGVSYPGRHERTVTKVTSTDHPGAAIHVAGPAREDPGEEHVRG